MGVSFRLWAWFEVYLCLCPPAAEKTDHGSLHGTLQQRTGPDVFISFPSREQVREKGGGVISVSSESEGRA